MFRLWRTEKQIQERLDAYLAQVTGSLHRLKEIFPACLDGTLAAQESLDNPVHKLESVADDMRRELEQELFSGKLLPESRAEMLRLVESIDRLPNIAENIVDLFAIQKLAVPEDLRADITRLLLKALEACAAMSETVRLLLADIKKIQGLAAEVDALESECDSLERHLLRQIFNLDLELARRLHLRDLVRTVAGLADHAENVTDMVQLMALKRNP